MRKDRRDCDARADPGARETLDRAQALRGRRDRRLDLPRELRIERRQADANGHPRRAREVAQHVDIAHDERRARRDVRGGLRANEFFEDAARQPIAAFERLIRIGRRPDEDALAFPRRLREFAPHDLGRVDLHVERRAPIGDAVAFEECVRVARVAEDAAMVAAAIGIERPSEAHAADAIEHRFRLDLNASHPSDPFLDFHRTYVRC